MMDTIPSSLVHVICTYLVGAEVVSLRSTCKTMQGDISSRTWLVLLRRDFDIQPREIGFALINPYKAYVERTKNVHARGQAQRTQADRQAFRRTVDSRREVHAAGALAMDILAAVLLPAPAFFIFLLMVGLRADEWITVSWSLPFLPLYILACAWVGIVSLTLMAWKVKRAGWWSPSRRIPPPLPQAVRTPPGTSEPQAQEVRWSPWWAILDALAATPTALCLEKVTGPGPCSVAYALLLFLLLGPFLVISLSVQAVWVSTDAASSPSWAVAFLPLWLFLAALPAVFCGCTKLRGSPEGMSVFVPLLACVCLPILCLAIPLSISLDQRTAMPAASLTAFTSNSTDMWENGTGAFVNGTAAGATTGRGTIPIHLALVPVWLITSMVGVGIVGIAVVACARFARARLRDLKEECCAVQLLSFIGFSIIGLPVTTLALLSAKSDGSLQAFSWTACLAPMLFLLAVLTVFTTVAGAVECHFRVTRPCLRAKGYMQHTGTSAAVGAGKGDFQPVRALPGPMQAV